MQSVPVVVPKRFGYDGLRLLVVGKIVRPDVLALEGVVERLYVAVLLGRAGQDECEVDTHQGCGLPEPFIQVLGSVVALKGQPRVVRFGCGDGLDERLDGDGCSGQSVELVGYPLPSEDV